MRQLLQKPEDHYLSHKNSSLVITMHEMWKSVISPCPEADEFSTRFHTLFI